MGDGRNLRNPQQQQQQQQQWSGAGPQRRISVFNRLGGPVIEDQGMQQHPQRPQQHRQPQPYQQRPPPRPQQQQQQPPPAARGPPSSALRARMDDVDVLVAFNGNDIVKVCPNGDVYLSHGGDQSDLTMAALNEVLEPILLKVVAVGDAWTVSDGRAAQRFSDGMLIKSKGPATTGRALAIKEAMGLGGGAAAAAASAASMAAAMEAGILTNPQNDAALRRLRAQGRA